MSSENFSLPATAPAINGDAQPHRLRTGFKCFPYAARQFGHWWVLRLNYGFPEHDMYTLFVDGEATVDITGIPDHSRALVRSAACSGHSNSLLPSRHSTSTRPQPWSAPSLVLLTTATSTMTPPSFVTITTE
jgi:hypothetical protein